MIPVGTEIRIGPFDTQQELFLLFSTLEVATGEIYLFLKNCAIIEDEIVPIIHRDTNARLDVSVMDITLRGINHETCHSVCQNLGEPDKFDDVIENKTFEVCGL